MVQFDLFPPPWATPWKSPAPRGWGVGNCLKWSSAGVRGYPRARRRGQFPTPEFFLIDLIYGTSFENNTDFCAKAKRDVYRRLEMHSKVYLEKDSTRKIWLKHEQYIWKRKRRKTFLSASLVEHFIRTLD